MSINRRSILASIPACGLAAVVPAAAIPGEVEAPQAMTPLERAEHHIEQARLAMEEHSGEWGTYINLRTGLIAVSRRVA